MYLELFMWRCCNGTKGRRLKDPEALTQDFESKPCRMATFHLVVAVTWQNQDCLLSLKESTFCSLWNEQREENCAAPRDLGNQAGLLCYPFFLVKNNIVQPLEMSTQLQLFATKLSFSHTFPQMQTHSRCSVGRGLCSYFRTWLDSSPSPETVLSCHNWYTLGAKIQHKHR